MGAGLGHLVGVPPPPPQTHTSRTRTGHSPSPKRMYPILPFKTSLVPLDQFLPSFIFVSFFFSLKILEDICPVLWYPGQKFKTGVSVVSKPEWIPCLRAFSPTCNRFVTHHIYDRYGIYLNRIDTDTHVF